MGSATRAGMALRCVVPPGTVVSHSLTAPSRPLSRPRASRPHHRSRPMLFLKEEHLQVREMARRFADEVVAPRARDLDEREEFPHDIVKQMGELGFMGLPFPEKYGGAGLDTLSYAIAVEEIARACGSTALTLAA